MTQRENSGRRRLVTTDDANDEDFPAFPDDDELHRVTHKQVLNLVPLFVRQTVNS